LALSVASLVVLATIGCSGGGEPQASSAQQALSRVESPPCDPAARPSLNVVKRVGEQPDR
jgi:hypothetical protein